MPYTAELAKPFVQLLITLLQCVGKRQSDEQDPHPSPSPTLQTPSPQKAGDGGRVGAGVIGTGDGVVRECGKYAATVALTSLILLALSLFASPTA
mmetsp:Transcript_25454/g.38069  ORF Transcript_25454/g.38069 Transcript_25454/m.38069 type:complete len:95 (-) Transcript_25454:973-1257(-)